MNFKIAWRNLFRNSRRTCASLITVAIGAGGLLIYQGFNVGIMNQYRENTIRVRYGNGQVFPQSYYDRVLEEPWSVWIDNREEIEKKLLKIPEIVQVFPRVSFYGFLNKGGINLAGRGEGILPERESKFFTAMNFEIGKDISNENEIILGKGLAKSLDAQVGDIITILAQTIHGQLNGLDVSVAGVFHTGSKEFDDTFFRIHLNAAQMLLDTQKVEHFALQTTGVEAWSSVKNQLKNIVPHLDSLPFDDLDAVYYKNAVAFLDSQFQFIRTIMLLIVALGIFNTITVGLFERSGEVGALKANGEPRKRLFTTLALESFLLGVLGGLLGIVLALIINHTLLVNGIPMPPGPGITRQFHIFLEIQPSHFVQALILPALATILSSLWPIYKLIKRPIPELLR